MNRAKLIISISLVLITGTFFTVAMVGSQKQEAFDLSRSGNQEACCHSDSDKETKQLIERLKDRNTKEPSSDSVFEAIHKLGSIRCEKAIPEIIKYLDYEKKFETANSSSYVVETWDYVTLSRKYPAIEALMQIGKPALPNLIRHLESEEIGGLKSNNALYVVQQIFREDLRPGIELLQTAASKATSPEAKKRLHAAAEKIRQEMLKVEKALPKKN